MKFLFKGLLMGNYCFARRWVNKKMPYQVIPATVHIFTSPFAFISAGIYAIILDKLTFKFESYLPIFIFLVIVMLGVSYPTEYYAKKAIYQWGLEKEYKSLSKGQKTIKMLFAFCFFWFGFALFFYLAIKYVEGYLINA